MESATAPAGTTTAAAFVERFREIWRNPTVEALVALGHDDAVLEQPMLPRAVGIGAARESLARLLGMFPGLTIEVLDWRGDDERVFIEIKLHIPHRRPLEWTVMDVIRLDGGLVTHRITYGDPLPLALGILTRPALWRPLIRNRPPLRRR